MLLFVVSAWDQPEYRAFTLSSSIVNGRCKIWPGFYDENRM
jgi:hypothetical protein